jgi:hypothetical protein
MLVMTLPTRRVLSGDDLVAAGKGERVAGEMDIESVLVVLSSMQLPSMFVQEEEDMFVCSTMIRRIQKERKGKQRKKWYECGSFEG